jgi:hypothetical protein
MEKAWFLKPPLYSRFSFVVGTSKSNSNTDKMSDGEKLPIALMGLAGVSLPFVLGMIALYAAK